MRINSFEWDQINIGHIDRHSVSIEEAEEACLNSPLVLKGRWRRYYVLGQTEAGRYLTVVLEAKAKGIVRVITAREMSESERRRYARR